MVLNVSQARLRVLLASELQSISSSLCLYIVFAVFPSHGKDKLGYITGDSPQPLETDPLFRKWRTENAIVKGWLINSMDPSLIGDIQKYNSILQEDRVHVFLDGSDDRLDKIRSDVLQLQPFPTVELAYAHVRREDIRQAIMTSSSNIALGAVMASKGLKLGKPKSKPQSDGTKCTHCGNVKHTRETCFKLHGYPEWWNDFQAWKKCEGTSTNEDTRRAAVASAKHQLSLTAQPESTNLFTTLSDQGAGTVALSSPLSLNHTLLVPSLSNKLLSVSQVTTDLNCVVLMYPTFCLLQDILTKEIIGRAKIKTLRTDNGGEYVNTRFQTYFKHHGLIHETSCSQTPQQNGIAERKNRHILEMARALLIGAHVPSRHWDDAVTTAIYLLNRMPSKVLQFRTPLQALSSHTSLPTMLMLPPQIFGYRCFDPIIKRTYITMDVTFLEMETFYPSPTTKSSLHGEFPNEEVNWLATTWLESEGVTEQPTPVNDMTPNATTSDGSPSLVPEGPSPENIAENRGKPPSQYSPEVEDRRSKYPVANYVSTHRLVEPLKAFAHKLFSYYILKNVEEALLDSQWSQAIKEELKALEKNDTWKLVQGEARGGNLNWPLHQFDVKNAFLHGNLEEEVFMNIPPRYSTTPEDKVVCKLNKALYGLKQSPRAWFSRFRKVTALIIYIDNMIITSDDKEEISKLQKHLLVEFEMKNLGGLKYFLGIEVSGSKQGIFSSQRKYVLDLLSEVGMLECKLADTPIVQNHQLGIYVNQVPTDKERYQRIVGKLIYLSHTRLDIAYAISVVSQFMHCPSEAHMNAVTRILWYLKFSPGKGLMFRKNNHSNVDGYTDADWAGNISDMKSTSGYFPFVGGNLVTWRGKKQKVVALSSAEVEF
ncbi:Retrovirus-related Pol polyprotein from transposon TNT 1-94 [Vitis vinifera]|uniref:Retrovirus-related Pol polyprotein from transposon TNT 1-94 n=1 Tax=Vitis vinifera TaxID=29760 RepID=A0A438CEI3_VITVI|nr:Retrovirus-related Pol polyprotein from transposon TNT 1-94 [Vitis vinifera]